MNKLQKFSVMAICAGFGVLAAQSNANSLLVDDFEDSNFVAEDWANALIGGTDPFTSPGLGLAIRTREVFPIGFADLESELTTANGSGVFQVGESGSPDGAQPFSQVAPSDRTTSAPQFNYQFTGFNIVRTDFAGFDSTPYKYVRFSAWLDSPAASYENIVDAGLVLNFADDVNGSATGPFDPTGTNVTPIPITSTPDAYLVEINNSTVFKTDPVFAGLLGTPMVDATAVRSMQIGLRRAEVASAQSNNLGTRWFLDDVVFYETEPDILTTGPVLNTLNENPVDSTTFDIVLNAEPLTTVTVNFSASDGSAFSFNPASFDFLPTGATGGANSAEWDQVQTISVSTVDNGMMNSSTSYDVEFSQVSDDLFYNNFAVAPLTINVVDDESTASVKDWQTLQD